MFTHKEKGSSLIGIWVVYWLEGVRELEKKLGRFREVVYFGGQDRRGADLGRG
jgi:hypothetical protein